MTEPDVDRGFLAGSDDNPFLPIAANIDVVSSLRQVYQFPKAVVDYQIRLLGRGCMNLEEGTDTLSALVLDRYSQSPKARKFNAC